MLKVYSWLGWLFAVLSVIMLAKLAFYTGGFVAPLQLTLDYYEGATLFLFGWATPYLKSTLGYLFRWTGWNIQLYPHWRHVFILMWLYVSADILSNWTFGAVIDGKKWRPRRRLAASMAVFGTVIALASGTAAGMVDLQRPTSNIAIAAIVVVGFILYEFGFTAIASTFIRDEEDSWWQSFRGHLAPVIQLSIAGAVILVLCAQAPRIFFIRALPSPAFGILVMAVVCLALYRLAVGILWTFRHRGLADRWSEVFALSISGPLGLRILKAIGGAALFILTSAGLKL